MATLNEITNAASIKGDVALGGGSTGAFEISTRPFELLNAYTLRYKKDQYDQAQIDADEKIKQLAKLTAYDLVNGLEKDKGELMEAQAQLIERRAKEARLGTPSSPKEKMAREVSFQTDIQGMLKKIDAANARKIKLDAYKAKIQGDNTISAKRKELMIKQAEDLFNSTDILTLPEIPDQNLTLPTIGEPINETVNYLRETPNGMINETKTQFSISANNKAAFLEGNNLMFPTLPPNATPQQQAEYEQRKLAFNESPIGGMKTATDFLNIALSDPNYKKTATTSGINVVGELPTTSVTAEVDFEKIKADNPIVGGILSVAERYNKYAQDRITEIKQGYYIDSITGEKLLLKSGDRAEDIPIIDVTKPLTPANLALLQRFAKAAPDKVDKKYTETDNAIQRENQRLDFKVAWKNAETARINATKPDGGSDGKATETIDKPAILFGQHIDRLKTWFKANPNKNLTVKYSSTDEKTRIATKLKPDQKIVYKLDGSYDIVDKNGVIAKGTIENLSQGFIEAVKASDIDPSKDKDGTMAEGFQRKSEAFFNETFGTTSGKAIWDGWDNKSAAPATTVPTTKVVSASTIKSKVGTKGFEGYTEQELIDYYKSQGYEIK